ncbi:MULTISPECIES: acyltransferase family protein [unclassified Microbacterium]|uniref:acyltransferase family protein n=1 Tax=unclassified Microbacterium TaxID=2609290 RepID=UPI00214BF8C3|nr:MULTISPECIES: acyltransferase family protein [unclassified Microbacterium]MCR2810064.1 acyltransferase family protein [Microbacterium sp. zg.B185]WIM20097.1 acyltransferase family protein [Microbacterium sp. zg-B185]
MTESTNPTPAAAAASAVRGPPAGSGAAPRVRRRVPFWDNARFACIALVVLGHAVQRLTYDSEVALALYLLVYAFHMPAFAIISGYFSKSDAPGRRQMARVLTDILLPYVIFESLWTVTKWLVEGQANPNPTQPSWTLWFLLALGIFRVVLPYLALLRWPLLWTIVISIGAGYLPNIDSTLSLSRTLGLLFFFTLGWWLRERDVIDRLGLLRSRPWWVFAASAAVLAAAGWLAWFFVDVWRAMNLREWLFYDENYSSIGGTEWWAGGVRLALVGVAIVLSTAFFAVLPLETHWWTHFGQYTMYVYLLHSFVLYPFRESGVLRDLDPTWIWLPVVIVASVLIALGLATRPVRTVFRPLVEPRPRWLFADPAMLDREGHRSDPTGSRRPPEQPRPAHRRADPRQNG